VSEPSPTSYFAQTWSLTASGGYASRVRVTRGSNFTVDVVPTGTKYFRTFLCGSAGTGASLTDPQEFLAYVEGLFNAAAAGWTVRMAADGRVELTNAAGTFAVPWTAVHASGAILRNLLGYAGDIPNTAAGTYVRADYLPLFTLASFARVGDEGWQPGLEMAAYEDLPDGDQYGWSSGTVRRSRTFDLQFQPTDAAAQSALTAHLTPAHAAKTRWKNPTRAVTTSLAPPWSVEDFAFTCGGTRLGCAFGDFADLVAGTATEIDVCTLAAKTIGDLRFALMQPGYARRRHAKGLVFHWYGTETL
jgi:hypothetical protein